MVYGMLNTPWFVISLGCGTPNGILSDNFVDET